MPGARRKQAASTDGSHSSGVFEMLKKAHMVFKASAALSTLTIRAGRTTRVRLYADGPAACLFLARFTFKGLQANKVQQCYVHMLSYQVVTLSGLGVLVLD